MVSSAEREEVARKALIDAKVKRDVQGNWEHVKHWTNQAFWRQNDVYKEVALQLTEATDGLVAAIASGNAAIRPPLQRVYDEAVKKLEKEIADLRKVAKEATDREPHAEAGAKKYWTEESTKSLDLVTKGDRLLTDIRKQVSDAEAARTATPPPPNPGTPAAISGKLDNTSITYEYDTTTKILKLAYSIRKGNNQINKKQLLEIEKKLGAHAHDVAKVEIDGRFAADCMADHSGDYRFKVVSQPFAFVLDKCQDQLEEYRDRFADELNTAAAPDRQATIVLDNIKVVKEVTRNPSGHKIIGAKITASDPNGTVSVQKLDALKTMLEELYSKAATKANPGWFRKLTRGCAVAVVSLVAAAAVVIASVKTFGGKDKPDLDEEKGGKDRTEEVIQGQVRVAAERVIAERIIGALEDNSAAGSKVTNTELLQAIDSPVPMDEAIAKEIINNGNYTKAEQQMIRDNAVKVPAHLLKEAKRIGPEAMDPSQTEKVITDSLEAIKGGSRANSLGAGKTN